MTFITQFPDLRHLRRRLRMSPEEAHILLDGNRMALIHGHALGGLRREMIDSIGLETTRGLLTRMGYASGKQDADTARRLASELDSPNAFGFGPLFYMLEGIVRTEIISVEIDVDRGHYHGEFNWHDSLEVDFQLRTYGPGRAPVCWMQTGYACGFTTAFVGRPILYRETRCRGMGDDVCHVVGKPFDEWGEPLDEIRHYQSEAFVNRTPRRASKRARERRRPESAEPSTEDRIYGADEMVGLSAGFNAAAHLVRKVAGTRAPVLFLGETGVGKELFARNLHAISDRAPAPFVAVNCAAIPESLIEAELFGVEKGAYTGAHVSRPGRFERADGGTLFLDEVGTLSFSAQGTLLRVLQTGEVERIGSTKTRKVDVRVVAATNEDLETKTEAGGFRSDLFYRLNVFPVNLPPLRERSEVLPHLMSYFLSKYGRLHRRRITGFTEEAIRRLLDYDYPGNIRELENMIERAVILAADDGPLDASLFPSAARHRATRDPRPLKPSAPSDDLPTEIRSATSAIREAVRAGRVSLDDFEHAVMQTAVEASGGNLSAAARRIGVTRRRLAYRLFGPDEERTRQS